MIPQSFFNSQIFDWGVIPLLIFAARICDVTLGTIRIILVSRGNRYIAPLLGFFEVFIWILAISQIMARLHNLIYYVAYAAGFATGNLVGILIEEKLALGIVGMQIITTKHSCRLKEILIEGGYGVTSVEAQGAAGQVNMIYTVIRRKNLNHLLGLVNSCGSKVFYIIEDVRMTHNGVFPKGESAWKQHTLSFLNLQKLFGSSHTKK